MDIRVLFFGATAHEVGRRRIEISVDGNGNVRYIFDQILEQFPKLRDHRLLFAINQEYVSLDDRLNEGDELAIFTAVSGG